MNLIKSVNLFVIVITAAAAHERHLAEGKNHRCGTRPPNESDIRAREYAKEFRGFLEARNPEYRNAPIQVSVCFHIPRKLLLGGSILSNTQLQKELDHLNRAFSAASCCDSSLSQCSGQCSLDTGISFVMAKLNANGNVDGTVASVASPGACVTRPKRRHWTRIGRFRGDAEMKKSLHKGDESTLNVYYTKLTGGILGYATLPADYGYWLDEDGVVMSRNAIRGGKAPYDEGDTLVHEVGHWLGLFHTFDGGCDPGDLIADTAPEGSPNFGCNPNEQRDTCPGDGKLDPIFNFMDYSDDKCLFEFTEGQIAAMFDAYLAYRSPGSRSARALRPIQEDLHEIGSLETGATQVFEMNDVPTDSIVTCHVEITHDDEGGNLDLFMNSHGRFSDFECTSESSDDHESCSLKVTSDTAYIFVHAMSRVSEFTVVCDIHRDELIG